MPGRINRKPIALVTLPVLLLICFAIVQQFTDRPVMLFHPAKAHRIGAIALRDDVIPFQKFGTRLFTLPYLERCYEEVIYLTEYQRGEKEEAFVEGINRLLSSCDSVDIFLLAHGNHFYEWVEAIDPAKRKRIRLVYNTGCGNALQHEQWMGLGIRSYVAHPGMQSQSPVFFFYFLRRWCSGFPLKDAVAGSNYNAVKKTMQLPLVDSTTGWSAQANCYGDDHYSISHEK